MSQDDNAQEQAGADDVNLGQAEYVRVGEGQLHLRHWGEGPPLVLLHDAGGSSAIWADLATRLTGSQPGWSVWAPDLIGTGGTTIDASLSGDLTAQADAIAAAMGTLGVTRCAILGDGAGAAVARICAQRHPDLVSTVVVLGAPSRPEDGEPPVWPSPDPHAGALFAMWDETVNGSIFRPWWHRTGAARLPRGLPDPTVLHEVFLDVAEHDGAHRALAEAAVQQWSALEPALEEVHLQAPSDDPVEVLGGLRKSFPQSVATTKTSMDVSHGTYAYVDVDGVRIHTRQFNQDGTGTPLLLLHSNPGSGQGLEGLAREIGRSRPTIVWDTPGHGRSQDLHGKMADNPRLTDPYVPLLVGMLDALGVEQCDLYGTHTGAGLAAELAIIAPDRVRSVVLDGVPLFDDNPDMVAGALAHYFIDMHPDPFGSHLRRAWGANVNTGLWWPHYNHTIDGVRTSDAYPPQLLHDMTLDMLRSAPYYARYYRAAWTWSATQRLPLLSHRTLVGTTPTDPLAAMTSTALALLPAGQQGWFAPFGRADSIPITAATITEFLDGDV